MKIVQTFWSGGRSPLEHSYGWSHAEYNLMSWTLSCLSLRKHYDRVELYTDGRGYEVLIGKLHLPYTAVHVVYDDDLCLPQHWAYAKIKTYSMQTEPFLHIDGDVYFPKPLPRELLDAPLVAQNREIGTAYYQGMMDRVLAHPEFQLPPFIRETLDNGTMASYNMGIFGGCDLDFIHRYCQEVFAFFESNRMNDSSVEYSNEECNVFFEQIFLAAMVDREKREVKGAHSQPVTDNGYFYKEFCNLEKYQERTFCHALGGLKRDISICRLLAKRTLSLFPLHYRRIRGNFRYKRTSFVILDKEPTEIYKYKAFVWNCITKWSGIDCALLNIEEELSAKGLDFISASPTEKLDYHIRKASFASIYNVGEIITPNDSLLFHARFSCSDCMRIKHIGVTYLSHRIGFDEVLLTENDCQILSLLGEKELPAEFLILTIASKDALPTGDEITRRRVWDFYWNEITRLVRHGILLASKHK